MKGGDLEEALQEILDDGLDFILQVLWEGAFSVNLFEEGFFVGAQVGEEFRFVFCDSFNGNSI